jgi:hypothetical protein
MYPRECFDASLMHGKAEFALTAKRIAARVLYEPLE